MHPDQNYGHLTYSQHGEDLLVVNIFKLIGIDKPSYLDLGAHHPINISNTALLYSRGSRGVNIEANHNLFFAFEINRREDKNICIGVHMTQGLHKMSMYDALSGLNTFHHEPSFAPSFSAPIECKTINQIVTEYCNGIWPDFLTMDLENLDYEILSRANFNSYKPKVICVEVRKTESEKFYNLLIPLGYFSLARCGENLIFVLNEYINLLR